MQDPSELARRIVSHHQAHVVTEILERRRLQLSMLDDGTPERPRERDDDPDLHGERLTAPPPLEYLGPRVVRPCGHRTGDANRRQPDDAVSSCGAPTGLDSGEPR